MSYLTRLDADLRTRYVHLVTRAGIPAAAIFLLVASATVVKAVHFQELRDLTK